jgi:hypothetical protein
MDKRHIPDWSEEADRRRGKRLNKVIVRLDERRRPFADGGVRRKIQSSDNPVEILRGQEAPEIPHTLTDAPEEALEWNEPWAPEKTI